MKQANQTLQKELISCVDGESITKAISVPQKNDPSNWSGDEVQNFLASILVPYHLFPNVPFTVNEEPQIRTVYYSEEREIGSILSENEEDQQEASASAADDASSRTPSVHWDNSKPKSLTNMFSSFVNSYIDAQLEAEKRESPVLYSIHEAWTEDVASMNDESGLSNEGSKSAQSRWARRMLLPHSLEHAGPVFEKEMVAPDHDDTVLGIAASFDKINLNSPEGPAKAVGAGSIGSYSNNGVVTSSTQNQVYDSMQKTWLTCTQEGGFLDAGLDRVADALVFPETQIPLPHTVRKRETKRDSRPPQVEGDLLDDIFEHAESQLCIASLPDMLDRSSGDRETIQERCGVKHVRTERIENQREDLLVGNSFTGASPEASEISCDDGESKVLFDNNHEGETMSSDFSPDPIIVVVAPWRDEKRSFDEKMGKKRGFLGRFSGRRVGKRKTAN